MNLAASPDQIIKLEKRYWNAMKSVDIEAAISLTKFPCIVAGPSGTRRVSEDEYRELMRAIDSNAYKNVEIRDPEVDLLNDETALISYTTEMGGMEMQDVSAWVRDDNGWRCAFHSENPKGAAKRSSASTA
jgi:hypothetical protein